MAYNYFEYVALLGRARGTADPRGGTVFDHIWKAVGGAQGQPLYDALKAADARGLINPPRGQVAGKIVTVAGSVLSLGAAAPLVASAGAAVAGAGGAVKIGLSSILGGLKTAAVGAARTVGSALKDQTSAVINNAVADATNRLRGAEAAVTVANQGATAAARAREIGGQLASNPWLLAAVVLGGAFVVTRLAGRD